LLLVKMGRPELTSLKKQLAMTSQWVFSDGPRQASQWGGRAKRPVRESDIMREHRKNPERTEIYSVVPGAKSPNRNGIQEFRPEFCRNLQPRID
jgi:hypothetical protein